MCQPLILDILISFVKLFLHVLLKEIQMEKYQKMIKDVSITFDVLIIAFLL